MAQRPILDESSVALTFDDVLLVPRPSDVLHLRDVPSADSKSLAGIPFNAKGLKHLGCRRNEMPFEDWVKLSKEARKASLMQWCRVEYNGQQGWVAGRFLKPDETQKQ